MHNTKNLRCKRIGVIGLIVLAVLSGGVSASSVEDGLSAYRRSDHTEAFGIWEQLSMKGDAGAQFLLAMMYSQGHGVEKNDALSVKWAQKSADGGNALGQTLMGATYYYGHGVAQDYRKAASWYRKAAEQGSVEAQLALGGMYEQGYGVSKYFPEAEHWYRAAAETGNAEGQYLLGKIYYFGDGVKIVKDVPKAVRWMRKAANQGHSGSQVFLAKLYYNGTGVPKDEANAYKWINLAAASGNEEAKNMTDLLGKALSRAQLAEGQRLSREWAEQHTQ